MFLTLLFMIISIAIFSCLMVLMIYPKLNQLVKYFFINKTYCKNEFLINFHFKKDVRHENFVNLIALTNLEYLSISGVYIRRDMFIGLDKLIGLKLNNCSLSPFSIPNIFCYAENLQSLEIIDSEYKPEYDKILSKELKYLKKLRVCITEYYIKNLDFLKFESLSKLEYLNLNKCKIKHLPLGVFSRLKYLKCLVLDYSNDIRPEIFLGLDNLETLVIKPSLFNHDDKKFALKRTFSRLRSLKTIEVSLKNIEYIDWEVFIHTPKLTHLRFSGINCKLDERSFTNFKHHKNLKTIEIAKSELNFVDSIVIETWKKSNIEIIMH